MRRFQMNKREIYSGKLSLVTGGGILKTMPSKEITIKEALDIVSSDKYKSQIEQIRKVSDSKERGELKKKLDYFIFGGTFVKRGNKNLIESSGEALFDLDHVDDKIKEKLMKDKYVNFVFRSPSGDGFKVGVKIPKVKDDAEYKRYWNGIKKHFDIEENDEATKDIARACFVSWDKELYYNEGSEVFEDCVADSWVVREIEKHMSGKKETFVKGVGMVENEVEDEFIKNVKEKWTPDSKNRQNLAMSVAGYLRKNKRLGLDSALSIVEGIARDCQDEEVSSRLAAVRATYGKDESEIKGVSGLKDLGIKEEGELLELDVNGRSMSNLCEDSAKLLSDKKILFYRPMARKIVEVGDIKINATGNNMFSSFLEMGDKRFITLVEKFAKVGYWKSSKFGDMFDVKSLSPVKASIILNSHILEESLPQITRIFSSPIPIAFEGKITFPKVGYDERFSSWRNSNSVDILNEDMSLDQAKGIIDKIYSEFCFKGEQDKINSIAALITPFSRGMFDKFNTNTPGNLYLGNREGVGKDCCAAIPSLVIDGQFQQDAPISNGGRVDDDELRKKITSAVRSGRVRMHFANNKGYLNSGILEKLLTDPYWTDRILSKNEEIIYPNELDISLSGNIPIRYTDDLERRLVFINLFYSQENINEREFKKTDLHGWILKNRSKILTALYCIVKDWFDNGRKKGSVAFSSFPEWANVVGGIMENAGYGSPCIRDDSNKILTGDSDSDEIKELFTLCYERYNDRPIQKSDIVTVIKESEDLFSYVDWENKGDQTRFSIKLRKYLGREFNKIIMNIKDISVRSNRQQFIFTKTKGDIGHVGHVGHDIQSVPIESKKLYTPIETYPKVAKVTKEQSPPHPIKSTPKIKDCPKCNAPIVKNKCLGGCE